MYWAHSLVPPHGASAYCVKVQSTDDGGCVLVGRNVAVQAASDIYVAKLNAIGDVEWQFAYRHLNCLVTCLALVGTDIYVGGRAVVDGHEAVLVMRLDRDGHVRWSNLYHSEAHRTIPSALLALPGDQVACAGRVETLNSGNQSFMCMLLAPDGHIEWQKSYDYLYTDSAGTVEHGQETATALAPIPNGGLLIGGHVALGPDPNDLWLVEVQLDGSLIHDMRVGGSGDDMLTAMKLLDDRTVPDPTYVLCGSTSSQNPNGLLDFMLLRVQLQPPGSVNRISINWAKAYRYIKASVAYDVIQMGDADLVGVGSTSSPYVNYDGVTDGVAIRVPLEDGALVNGWARRYGKPDHAEGFYSVWPLDGNRGFIVGGYNTDYPVSIATGSPGIAHPSWSAKDIWAMSLDSNGACPEEDVTCVVPSVLPERDYPAPRDLDWIPRCPGPDPEVLDLALENTPITAVPVPTNFELRQICGRRRRQRTLWR